MIHPDTKVHELTFLEALQVHDKLYKPNERFNVVLGPNLEYLITEQEVMAADKKEYPFLDESNLKLPADLSRDNLDEKAKIEAFKADIEANLADVSAKLDEAAAEAQTPIKK